MNIAMRFLFIFLLLPSIVNATEYELRITSLSGPDLEGQIDVENLKTEILEVLNSGIEIHRGSLFSGYDAYGESVAELVDIGQDQAFLKREISIRGIIVHHPRWPDASFSSDFYGNVTLHTEKWSGVVVFLPAHIEPRIEPVSDGNAANPPGVEREP